MLLLTGTDIGQERHLAWGRFDFRGSVEKVQSCRPAGLLELAPMPANPNFLPPLQPRSDSQDKRSLSLRRRPAITCSADTLRSHSTLTPVCITACHWVCRWSQSLSRFHEWGDYRSVDPQVRGELPGDDRDLAGCLAYDKVGDLRVSALRAVQHAPGLLYRCASSGRMLGVYDRTLRWPALVILSLLRTGLAQFVSICSFSEGYGPEQDTIR